MFDNCVDGYDFTAASNKRDEEGESERYKTAQYAPIVVTPATAQLPKAYNARLSIHHPTQSAGVELGRNHINHSSGRTDSMNTFRLFHLVPSSLASWLVPTPVECEELCFILF